MTDYDIVSEDGADSSRFPVHSEEAFQRGIQYKAKFIGSLDVPRPQSRVEIVAAMRRIRFEFKAKAIKKRKVTISISVDGVSVICRRARRRALWLDSTSQLLMHHPIYRIFYVSHDSQDLKIFSYIARDSQRNAFKCSVFKAYKKAQAMRIVRTIGQAFEVCHQLSLGSKEARSAAASNATTSPVQSPGDAAPQPPAKVGKSGGGTAGSEASPAKSAATEASANGAATGANGAEKKPSTPHGKPDSASGESKPQPPPPPLPPPPSLQLSSSTSEPVGVGRPRHTVGTITSPMAPLPPGWDGVGLDIDVGIGVGIGIGGMVASGSDPEGGPLWLRHRDQLIRQRLEQQSQQAQVAMAQARLLRDQLAAEASARVEAQARAHQLLVQNRDLLDHLNQLVHRLRLLELRSRQRPPELDRLASLSSGASTLTRAPSGLPGLPDKSTPLCPPVEPLDLPELKAAEACGLTPLGEAAPPLLNSLLMMPAVSATAAASNSACAPAAAPASTSPGGQSGSPDSGHKEMSADSLSQALTFLDAYPAGQVFRLSHHHHHHLPHQLHHHRLSQQHAAGYHAGHDNVRRSTQVPTSLSCCAGPVNGSAANGDCSSAAVSAVSSGHQAAVQPTPASQQSSAGQGFAPSLSWPVSFADSPKLAPKFAVAAASAAAATAAAAASASSSTSASASSSSFALSSVRKPPANASAGSESLQQQQQQQQQQQPPPPQPPTASTIEHSKSKSLSSAPGSLSPAHLNYSFEWHGEVALAAMDEGLDED